MCGRFTCKFSWKEIHDILEEFVGGLKAVGEGVQDHPARFNIAPTQPIVTVFEDIDRKGETKAGLMRWGLVPTWVKDPQDFPLIINARSETVLQKPAFRGGMRHHRCLIPASGYYEWKKGPDGKKQPYYITTENGEPMFFAGLYSNWMGPSGEEVDTTAIITVPAGPELKHLHDRTPVILPNALLGDWLNVREIDAKTAHTMLVPLPEGVVRFYPVSTRVNAVKNDGESLIDLASEQKPEAPAAKAPRKKKVPGQGELF